VPDAAGEAGARELLEGVRALGPDDLLLCLVSGGGSSLLSLPAPGVPMDKLKAMTQALLRSGVPIQDMNTVRKHLSAIQGGRLAAACRGTVLALIVSDVVGDDPTHIASGPCAPDPSTIDDARAVLAKYGIKAPGPFSETPKPGDRLFTRVENRVIATARRSLEAAAKLFEAKGIAPTILGDDITGEAREVATDLAAKSRAAKRPSVLISGGECTVSIRGAGGRGGRCGEFLLALALEGVPGVHAIAADTDGIDGSEDNAGALLSPDSLARAAARGVDAKTLLAANDSYGFFAALGDLVVTGPTRTNVNDYRAIVVA
jgi:hydroxypyruvate reductase